MSRVGLDGKLLCFVLQPKILGTLKFTPACMRNVRIPNNDSDSDEQNLRTSANSL